MMEKLYALVNQFTNLAIKKAAPTDPKEIHEQQRGRKPGLETDVEIDEFGNIVPVPATRKSKERAEEEKMLMGRIPDTIFPDRETARGWNGPLQEAYKKKSEFQESIDQEKVKAIRDKISDAEDIKSKLAEMIGEKTDALKMEEMDLDKDEETIAVLQEIISELNKENEKVNRHLRILNHTLHDELNTHDIAGLDHQIKILEDLGDTVNDSEKERWDEEIEETKAQLEEVEKERVANLQSLKKSRIQDRTGRSKAEIDLLEKAEANFATSAKKLKKEKEALLKKLERLQRSSAMKVSPATLLKTEYDQANRRFTEEREKAAEAQEAMDSLQREIGEYDESHNAIRGKLEPLEEQKEQYTAKAKELNDKLDAHISSIVNRNISNEEKERLLRPAKKAKDKVANWFTEKEKTVFKQMGPLLEQERKLEKKYQPLHKKVSEYRNKILGFEREEEVYQTKKEALLDIMPVKVEHDDEGEEVLRRLNWSDFFGGKGKSPHPKVQDKFWNPLFRSMTEDPNFNEFIKAEYPSTRDSLRLDEFSEQYEDARTKVRDLNLLLMFVKNPKQNDYIIDSFLSKKQDAEENLKLVEEDKRGRRTDDPEIAKRLEHFNDKLADANEMLAYVDKLQSPEKDEAIEQIKSELQSTYTVRDTSKSSLEEGTNTLLRTIAKDMQKSMGKWLAGSLAVNVDGEKLTGDDFRNKTMQSEVLRYLTEMTRRAHVTGFQPGHFAYDERFKDKVTGLDKETLKTIQKNRFWQSYLVNALSKLEGSMVFERHPGMEQRVDNMYNKMRNKEMFYLSFWDRKKEEEDSKSKSSERIKYEDKIRSMHLSKKEFLEMQEEYRAQLQEREERGMSEEQIDREMGIWLGRKISEIEAKREERAHAAFERKTKERVMEIPEEGAPYLGEKKPVKQRPQGFVLTDEEKANLQQEYAIILNRLREQKVSEEDIEVAMADWMRNKIEVIKASRPEQMPRPGPGEILDIPATGPMRVIQPEREQQIQQMMYGEPEEETA